MQIELKELEKTNKPKGHYIRMLQRKGKLTAYVSPRGYAAYDTEELEQYSKTARRGRPLKQRGVCDE